MTAQTLKDLNSAPVKTKQICVQMPERQALVLKQYCEQRGLTPDVVVLAALCAMIESFAG